MATISTIKPLGGGDYTTLQAWEDWADDRVSAAQWAECYAGGNLGALAISNWTTTPDVTDYPKVYTPLAERHEGKWNSVGAYIVTTVTSIAVRLIEDYCRIEGLRINQDTAGYAIYSQTVGPGALTGIVLDSNLILKTVGGATAGIYADISGATTNNIIRNNIVINNTSGVKASGIIIYSSSNSSTTLYNNTVHTITAGSKGIVFSGTGGNIAGEVKNNIATGSWDFCYDEITVTLTATVTNNLSEDDTADDWGGAGNLINKPATDQFVQPGYDLRLKTGADAIDAGATIGTFDWDALHLNADNWRPQDSSWDMGALEGIVAPAPPSWYDYSWLYRVKITSDHTKIPNTNQLNFTGYSDLSDLPAEFWSHVKNGGGDIRVTEADGTSELPREIVSCDTGGDTGEVHFKAPFLSASEDVDFYIYYGNVAADDYAIDAEFGAENAWQDFEAVHHFQADFLDSTNNDFDATNNGTINATGKLGDGQDFSSDSISQATLLDVVPPAFSMEIWFKLDVTFDSGASTSQAIMAKENVSGVNRMTVYLDEADGKLTWFTEQGNQGNIFVKSTIVSWTGGVWYYVVVTWDTTNGQRIFINGALESSDGGETTLIGDGTLTDFYWGINYDGSGLPFDGKLDESRLSNVILSTDWIATGYNNQNSPSTFWSIGSEESGYTTITSDRSIYKSIFEKIEADRELHISGASLYSPVASDYTLPLDVLARIAEDRELPINTDGFIRADRTIPIWSGIDFYSYTMCVDVLGGTPADRTIPVDTMLRVKPDKSIPVDAKGMAVADRTIPIGVLKYIDNDLDIPVDILMGIRMDETFPFWAYHDPAENRVLGLSVFERIQKDREIPMATMLRVNKPVTIPIAVMSNLYKDIDILINVLQGIRAERILHTEASGIVVVDNRTMPIDFLKGLRQDAEIPITVRGWAAASFSIPIGIAQVIQQNIEIFDEAKQQLGPDRIFPVDTVGQTSKDVELLIHSLMGVAPDKELVTDASGSVAADRELITEWLKGVSLDKQFRVDPLEGIASDVEINLSILQGQAEQAIAADRAISLAIIQELKEDATLPVDALQRLEANVTLLLDAMTKLVSDNSIPIDIKYGGIIILSRKIRSLLITDGVYATLWKRGD